MPKNIGIINENNDIVNKKYVDSLTASDIGAIEDTTNSVTSSHLANSSVTNTKIANSAVTSGKIANGAVTREKLAEDALYSPMANPNLLDNWYFVNPINQRVQTEYSGNVYGIDRWYIMSTHKMQLMNNGLKITINSAANVNFIFKQIVENYTELRGKAVTLSALIEENTCVSSLNFRLNSSGVGVFAADATGLFTTTYKIPNNITKLELGIQTSNRNIDNDNYFVIKAIKLELGTQQTLAHQEDGIWVLNEIPNFGEQLARCQRYCYAINQLDKKYVGLYGYAHSSNEIRMVMPVPVPMRAMPVLSNTNGNSWSVRGAGGTVSINNISVWFASENGYIGLKLIANNLTTNTIYVATYSVEDTLIFSADL